MMIEWKKVDKDNPPSDGSYLFFFDGSIYEGWIIPEETDDEGFPLWETSEAHLRNIHTVRYYAIPNYPPNGIEKMKYMCCEKFQKELNNNRIKKDNTLFIVFKGSNYDEDYGYTVFEHKVKIEFCPFCGTKH